MILVFVICLVLCLIFYFKVSRGSRIIVIRNLFVPLLALIFVVLLIAFPKTCFNAAGRGLNLWLNTVVPSLLPFFIAAELLKDSSLVRAFGILLQPVMYPLFRVPGCGSFAFLMGTASGYPVGAKITSSLRRSGYLTKTQAERLLAFSNNSGPLFIVGAVSVGMFNIPQLGVLLLFCHAAASITVGLIFRFYGGKETHMPTGANRLTVLTMLKKELLSTDNRQESAGALLGNAVKNSISSILAIGGFIILFSVIINILLETGVIGGLTSLAAPLLSPAGVGKELAASLISGFFEITTGTKMASTADGAGLIQRITAAAAIIGWAGLSVHAQVISIINKEDISPLPYILGKLLHGIISGIYSFLALKTAGSRILSTIPAFLDFDPVSAPAWRLNLAVSVQCLLLCLFLIILAGTAQVFIELFRARKKKIRRMG